MKYDIFFMILKESSALSVSILMPKSNVNRDRHQPIRWREGWVMNVPSYEKFTTVQRHKKSVLNVQRM